MNSHFKIIVFAIALIGVTGCGLATYEERLKASTEFYDYMQTMEANLASPIWDRSDLGIKMRLPLPFRAPMAGPELLMDEDGEQYFGPDPRHPEILGTALPGIVDAWQAQLPGEAGDLVDSRVYVLSNHERFKLVDGAVVDAPTEFFTDLEDQLATLFGVYIPEGESDQPSDNVRYAMTVPMMGSQSAKFIEPKRYSVIRFVAEEANEGQGIQVLLHEHQAGDIQVAVLVLGPKSFSSQFRQRLEMALQTLSVQPQAAAQMNQATGTPQQGGVSGF